MKSQERINEVLSRLGINGARFCEEVGIPQSYLSKWRSGRTGISDRSAELINKRWPMFSVDWLMGRSDVMNDGVEIASRLRGEYLDRNERVAALLSLLGSLGYQIRLPHDEAEGEADAVIRHVTAGAGLSVVDGEGVAHKAVAVLCKDGERHEVPLDELQDVAAQLSSIAEVLVSGLSSYKESTAKQTRHRNNRKGASK